MQHCILGNQTHDPAHELAARLNALFPDERVTHFASDGASAVETAMKMAIQYRHNIGQPERHRIASLQYAYHGDTLATLSLGFLESFHAPYQKVRFPFLQADAPCMDDCAGDRCDLSCFSSMRDLVESHADELTAIVVEPLCQGAAGMRIYSPDWLRELTQLCREHDILLIADEIAVGLGRTGRMFACEHAAVMPDIVCLGKGLSGGYLPISAAVVRRDIFDTFDDAGDDNTFYHGHTFAGNPIGCAAACTVLKMYEEEGVVEQARLNGDMLADLMQTFDADSGAERVRTLGMIARFDAIDAQAAANIRNEMFKAGILIRPLGRAVYLMLPLITDSDTLRHCVTTLHQATLGAHTA